MPQERRGCPSAWGCPKNERVAQGFGVVPGACRCLLAKEAPPRQMVAPTRDQGPGTGTSYQRSGTRVQGPGPGTRNQGDQGLGPGTRNRRPVTKDWDQGPGTWDQGPGPRDQGPRTGNGDQGPGTETKDQGHWVVRHDTTIRSDEMKGRSLLVRWAAKLQKLMLNILHRGFLGHMACHAQLQCDDGNSQQYRPS